MTKGPVLCRVVLVSSVNRNGVCRYVRFFVHPWRSGWVSSTPFGVPFQLAVQFSRIGVVVRLPFVNDLIRRISTTFQHHFKKFVCWGCYMEKNVAFTPISFAVLKWDVCLSVTGSDQSTDRNFVDNFLQVVIYLYLVANI